MFTPLSDFPEIDHLIPLFAQIDLDLTIILVVAGILIVALVTALAPKVGVAGPLVLVALGIGITLIPGTPNLYLEPDWILIGILPPLLYAAAVSLPAMEFRRDFSAIGGLSVLLVLLSSLVLGLVFSLLIPDVGFAVGVALGAVLSPTDAVATSIVKKLGTSPRVVTMLEGESLLNDATALVLLKTAIAAAAAPFALWGSIGTFSWAVVIAVGIGGIVGWVNLRVRAWIPSTTAATAISFVVPYVAYLPSEHLGGSGLVAAVVAGIVTGQGAARYFTAEQRLSDRVNWRTIELMLEGAVFLIMGLELSSVINSGDEDILGNAAFLALLAFLVIMGMRTLYVIPLVWLQGRRAKRGETIRPHLEQARDRFQNVTVEQVAERGARNPERRLASFRRRISRSLGDIAYLESSQLGWREGTLIVWAGMRGAVTLAAAQTLPPDTPNRSLLIVIAFLVAVGTLLVQGSTIKPLIRALGLTGARDDADYAERLAELNASLREAASKALANPDLHREDGRPFDPELLAAARERMVAPPNEAEGATMDELRAIRLVIIQAQRQRLTSARSNGRYSTAMLRRVLEGLDAEELSIRAHLPEG